MKRKDQKKEKTEVKTFTVPFALEEVQENIITINKNLKLTKKEQIVNQAFQFHSQGNITKAAEYYQYFIDEGFKDAQAFSNYGLVLKKLGRLNEAETLYRKAIELKPDYAIAYSNLGSLLNELSKLEEAKLSNLKAIEINPTFAAAHLNLGNVLLNIGNLQEAENSYRKAIELQPDSANAYSNLAIVLQDLGKLEEVVDCYSKALELRPNYYAALKNRSKFFFSIGEFELALKDADSCNKELTRALALESLYALGRVDEIYERIDKTSLLDSKNIRLAAFSSFISIKEGKDTSNNFCPNPLSFLYFSNLKAHIKDYQGFTKEIINELDSVETVWQPRSQTTFNGFQTPIHRNIFSNCLKNISQLQSIILNELEKYYVKYGQDKCSYIQEWPSTKNLVGWHVILKKQGYQSAHIHPAGWLSGVIYLKVVPPLERDEGSIEFSLNGVNYFDVNSPQLTHQPEVGDIVLFPSSLHHRTIPFSTDTDRIVISFDLMPG